MQNSCISFIILLTLTSVLFTLRSSYMASLSRMRLYTKIRVNEYLASIILTRSHTWGDKHNCIITQIGEACHIQNSSSMFVSKDYKHFKLILYLLFLCWILFRSICFLLFKMLMLLLILHELKNIPRHLCRACQTSNHTLIR